MSAKRSSQPLVSGALVALSLAVCLGAVANASAAPGLLASRVERPTLSSADREALASLLSCFSDAARRLHQPTPLQPAALITRPGVLQAGAIAHHLPPATLSEHPPARLTVGLHLLNLPPPTM